MLLFTNVTSETSVANDSFTSFFARDIKLSSATQINQIS